MNFEDLEHILRAAGEITGESTTAHFLQFSLLE